MVNKIILTLVFPLCQAGGVRGGESLLRAEDDEAFENNRHRRHHFHMKIII